jgi:hypothetical protein
MLVQHDPSAYLALLSRLDAQQTEPKLRPGHELESQVLVNRIATGYSLLQAAPKVNGTMTVGVGKLGDLDVLDITTNYVVAYPFRPNNPEDATQPLDIVALSHSTVHYQLLDGPNVPADARGVYWGDAEGYDYSVNCDLVTKGFLAPSYSDHNHVGTDTENPDNYFDPNRPYTGVNGCDDPGTSQAASPTETRVAHI